MDQEGSDKPTTSGKPIKKEDKEEDKEIKEKKPIWKKKKKNLIDDDDDDESRKKAIQKSKAAGSALSVRTLDLYDPYEYREELQMGHLSTFMAWAHLVKCSFGTGVLTMPKGFAHAGMIPGVLLGIGVGGFCVFCMHILLKSCVHIAARERQPYIPFNETMRYTFLHGYPACKPIAKVIKSFTDFVIVGYHFGICIAYVNYLGQTSLQIIGEGEHTEGYNWQSALSVLSWIPFLCLLNLIRNLKWLAPVSIAGNVLTALSMGIILYYVCSPDDEGRFFAGPWHYFGSFISTPVYIGIILFAVEAFGVIIAVERDMKHPRKFLGLFGTFNQAMGLVLLWYLSLGIMGYLRYGIHVKSTISLTIPQSPAATTMQVCIALALFCSYPLHLFVCIDIIWYQRVVPRFKDPEKRKLFREYMFRFSMIIISGIIAFCIPQLDLLVSLVGAVCLSFLGIMMPGIMEYNVAWSKYGNQWSWTMIKDMLIAAFGALAFLIGSYGAMYGLIFKDEESEAEATTNATLI